MEAKGVKIEFTAFDLNTKKIEEKILARLDSDKTSITSFTVEEYEIIKKKSNSLSYSLLKTTFSTITVITQP